MRTLRRWWRQALGALRIGRDDGDFAAEMQAHIALEAEENLRRGMTPEEAQRQARASAGSMAYAMEELRDQRSFPWLEQTLQDLKHSLRGLRRRPAFTLVAVLSLAFGIGANATVFSWFRAVYLDPLPGVREARQLVTINAELREGAGYSNSYADYEFIRSQSRLLDQIFAHEMLSLAVGDGQSAEVSLGGIVSGHYFDALGLRMAHGRGFRKEEDQVPDRNPVLVMSDGLWRRRFGARASILGERITLNGIAFEVVGIAPPGFVGVYGGIRQDYWIPLNMNRALNPNGRDGLRTGSWLQIMARPQAGVTLDQLQAELNVFSRQMLDAHRKGDGPYRARVFALHQANRGFHSGIYGVVRVLGVAVALILLLACLNIANLLVARAMDRQREMSVRLSLGAGRGRLIRQLLTECLVLALLSGAVAVAFALWSRRIVDLLNGPREAQLVLNQPVDWLLFAFLLAVSIVAALLFGLLPALESTRINLTDSLKENAGSVTGGRRRAFLRGALVTAEVALATAALTASLQMTKFFYELHNADRGFVSENVVTASTDLAAAGIAKTRAESFYRTSVEQLERRPEIEAAAWTTYLPMNGSGGGNRRRIQVPGYAPADGQPISVVADYATPGFFRTLKIPLAEGRDFVWNEASPVVMVNQKFADEFFAGHPAAGAQVIFDKKTWTIAGVYRNYIYRNPTGPVRPAMMLPITNHSSAIAIVRSKTPDPGAAAIALSETIRGFDRALPVSALMTMNDSISDFFMGTRVAVVALAVFSGVALVLAGLGLYGVLAGFVNQRQREFGVRSALGATPGELCALVVRQSGLLTLVGLATGGALGYLATRAMLDVFGGMKPAGVFVYAFGALAIALLAMVAAALPARRVARLDPLTALRYE